MCEISGLKNALFKKQFDKTKHVIINVSSYISGFGLIDMAWYLSNNVIEFKQVMNFDVYELLKLYRYKLAYDNKVIEK